MSKHTPGEWRHVNGPPIVIPRNIQRFSAVTVYADDGKVATVLPYTESDAWLMEAAPDLLAACEAYIASITLSPSEQYRQEDMLDSMMLAAVRKAKGK